MRIIMPLRYCMLYASCASTPFLQNESFYFLLSSSKSMLSRDSKKVLVLYYYNIVPFTYFLILQIINMY